MSSLALTHRPLRTKRHAGAAARALPKAGMSFGASAFLLAATLAYLCIEIPFAARLVDVLASDASASSIHEIERTGRLVSGLAVALLAWGYILRGDSGGGARKPLRTGLMMLISLAGGLLVMGYGQRSFVDTVAEASSPGLRQAALKGAILRDAFHKRKPDAAGDAASLAVAASLPALGSASTDGLASLSDPAKATKAYAASLLPNAQDIRKRAYDPAMTEARTSFATYREGADKIVSLSSTTARKSSDSYRDLWNELRERRVTGIGNAQVNLTIADNVRARGIPVPKYWDPRDEQAFHSAFGDKYRREAWASYEASVRSALGPGVTLSPDLRTFEAFVAAAPVQSRIRRSVGLPETGPLLRAAPGEAEFAETVVNPIRAARTADFQRAIQGDIRLLSDGTNLSQGGREAVRMAVATSLALVLSALGALGHLAKASNHALALAGATPRIRVAATATLFGVLVALSLPGSSLSANAAWSGAAHSPWGMALGWAIGAHGMIHPAGTLVGSLPGAGTVQHLLAGFAGA